MHVIVIPSYDHVVLQNEFGLELIERIPGQVLRVVGIVPKGVLVRDHHVQARRIGALQHVKGDHHRRRDAFDGDVRIAGFKGIPGRPFVPMVFARSAKALSDDLGSEPDPLDELKRLADVLDLRARAFNKLGRESGLCRLHALKFYQVARMPVSLMNVGMDVVDEFIRLLRDPVEARRVLEDLLLPIVKEYRLLEYVVPVQGQYAVVLARCGDISTARRLIRELRAFTVSEEKRIELEGRVELIEQVALEAQARPAPRLKSIKGKIGRNDPCPCGSGRRYKKCHGG
jgi:hypothetical protein